MVDVPYWRTKESIDKIRTYADIGEHCYIATACTIDGKREQGRVSIGDRTVIAEGVMILCHDAACGVCGLHQVCGDTKIGNNCFIGIRTVVLVGRTIGDNSIVGACSVITKDIPPNQVWGGNPAKFICTIEEFKEKHK